MFGGASPVGPLSGERRRAGWGLVGAGGVSLSITLQAQGSPLSPRWPISDSAGGEGARLQTHPAAGPICRLWSANFLIYACKWHIFSGVKAATTISPRNTFPPRISPSKTAASPGISDPPAETRGGESYTVVCMNSCASEGCRRGESPAESRTRGSD